MEARIALGILAVIMVVLALRDGGRQPATVQPPRGEAAARAVISDDAISPDTDIAHMVLARQAALILARDPRCDRVWHAGKAMQSTRTNLAVYADCENGYRLRLDADGREAFEHPRQP